MSESETINDSSATAVAAGNMDVANTPLIDQIMETMTFDLSGQTYPGAQLIYPFYGGHSAPKKPITVPYGGFATSDPAGTLYPGQTAIVIVNMTDHALTVTRPYRDGGWMTVLPMDVDGTQNRIPGRSMIGGTGHFGIGGYFNDTAWAFRGGGAVLKLTSDDTTKGPALIGYGASINGGWTLGVTADAGKVPDCEAWYTSDVGNLLFRKTVSIGDPYGDLSVDVCIGSQHVSKNAVGYTDGGVMMVRVT